MTTGNQISQQEIRLLAHNKMAYNAVKRSFTTRQRAAVVHATGTGKSYIIARTAQDFSKVLIIAPNDFVLDETRKICPPRCHFKTYTSVMLDEEPETGYNLIVLDEFHRAGAELWGKGVQRLIDANPNAKILGTSANDIRYLDGMRNMADELFEGNVVSKITLKDAIDLGILPNPTYVSSLYSLDQIEAQAVKTIEDSRKSDEEKEEGLKHLKGVKESWEMSHGVPVIIKKYFRKDMKRIIVFCPDVAMATQCRDMLRKWFNRAGYNYLHFYDINYSNKNLKAEMDDFQKDEPGLKIAISINMLNEGVHVPNVDAIIMLRNTMSRIIIEQQIGRCLTAKNSDKAPVVLDLVNNLDSIVNFSRIIIPSGQESINGPHKEYERQDAIDPFPFHVIDEAYDIRTMMTYVNNTFSVWQVRTKEECQAEALKYKTRTKFYKGSNAIYAYARFHGWLDEICSHMQNRFHYWTKEEVMAEVSKCTTLKEFRETQSNMYIYAINKGWKDDINSRLFVNKKPEWTLETCKAEAKKYDTRKHFNQGSGGAYEWARKNKVMDEVCSHMKPVTNKRRNWTRESVFAFAAQCSSKSDLRAKAASAYIYARKNGFWDELKYNNKK